MSKDQSKDSKGAEWAQSMAMRLISAIFSIGLKRVSLGLTLACAAILGTCWAAVTAYGKSVAGKFAQELVKPVTDSLAARVSIHDTLFDTLIAESRFQRRVQEISIAAQRRSDPRYDRELKAMLKKSASERRQEHENRELLRNLVADSTAQNNFK